ncbi:MAG TPA: hypothetical protein VM324_04940 [Egibacteraceae bacterium]|nr:hypothetical protein [Egibacteraceae bacterium]
MVGDHAARLLDDRVGLETENAALRAELVGVRAERDLFAAQVRADTRRIAGLEGGVARLERQVEVLQDRLEAAARGQASVGAFSKGEPTPAGERGRPGRKPGEAYATRAHPGGARPC